MARAIDCEAAYRFLSEQFVKETGAFSKGVNKGLNIARSAMRNPDAIPTLRPVSREQVEKVWRGEWNYSHTTEIDHFAVVKCSKCGHEAFAIALYVKDGNFCPACGAPMTDEAVQMVMERLEALYDTGN